MVRDLDTASGDWVRADDYVLEGGVIRPLRVAAFRRYHLDRVLLRSAYVALADQVAGGVTPGTWGVHPSLIMWRDKLDPNLDLRALNWCKEYGLLGLLSHQALSITLPPQYSNEEIGAMPGGTDDEPEWEPEYATVPSQRTHARLNGRWTTVVAMGPVEESLSAAGIVSVRPFRAEEEPAAIISRWDDGITRSVPHRWLGRFFPDVLPENYATFQWPRPLSSEFWPDYGEPVAEVLRVAAELRDIVRRIIDHSVTGPTLDQLNRLLGAVTITPVKLKTERIGRRLTPPSLLAWMTLAILRDAERSALRLCDGCGRFYTSDDPKSKYHSSKCQDAAAKRRKRGARRSARVRSRD